MKTLVYKALEQPILPPASAPSGWDSPSPAQARRSTAIVPINDFPFAPPAAATVITWGWQPIVPLVSRSRINPLPPEAMPPLVPATAVAAPAWGWQDDTPPQVTRAIRAARADFTIGLLPPPPAPPLVAVALWQSPSRATFWQSPNRPTFWQEPSR